MSMFNLCEFLLNLSFRKLMKISLKKINGLSNDYKFGIFLNVVVNYEFSFIIFNEMIANDFY